ncbi:wax ester/triacylglycerol synthase domain-containing protein [Streptomyces sp. NRRL S-920]|uniref:wax ester/triacylglycerol synthase domain-containing protein n=1 Tax=Streptomyces sp. NRRL S-920 TaxID=1463921 RepID=UPI0004C5E6C5|nr:wax ester/triacylglycerol synthase domain-containing protein [Streptomyces sp. NRRL S-920]
MRLSGLDEGFVRTGLSGTIGTAALFTGEPFDLAELRSRVGERWGGLDRMRQVLEAPRGPAALSGHRWAAGRPFDPAAHVVACEQELRPLLSASVGRRLRPDRPLWQLLVPKPAPNGEHALVLLAHHALIDGSSMATLLRLLMDDSKLAAPRAPVPPPAAPSPSPLIPTPRPERPRVRPAALFRECRDSNALGQRLPLASGEAHPSLAVTRLDPDVMRSARRRPAGGRGATLNELLLGAVAGALPTCYGTTSSWPRGRAPLYATVPVDLRDRYEAQQLGNFITAVRIPLPLGADSAAGRLHTCQNLMADLHQRRQTHHAALPVLEGAARAVPWLTAALAKRMIRPEVTTAVCTAFKWRDNPSHLLGRRLSGVVSLPALSSPGTTSLSLVQTADAYLLTVVSHLGPDDSGLIADAVAEELAALASAA